MKADAYPAAALPQLDIPSWVPDVIAQYVGARYAAEVARVYREALRLSESGYFENEVPDEHIDDLMRDDAACASVADLVRDELADITAGYLPLVADHRMKSVWKYLSRPGSNGGFRHPAIGRDQDAAMLALFDAAFECRQQREATTTQAAAERERDHYLAKANELRDDAVTMLVESSLDKSHERYQKLQDAAQAYEDHAGEIYAASQPMALERKHDGRARWVALTIGNTFRTLFGSLMYGLTTTITSVVLGREIKSRTVRQWLPSGLKTGT